MQELVWWLPKNAGGGGIGIKDSTPEIDHENSVRDILDKPPEANAVKSRFLSAYQDIRVIPYLVSHRCHLYPSC
jgi:hypothetical protein